jgi:hypothetical protein
MGVLQRFERRIENLVNRPFAKAFRAEVQPVEIAGALQRECNDRAAIVARGRTLVPNDFVVELGVHDYERLSAYADPLGRELSGMVREHAEEQHYSFVGPVAVHFRLADDLDTGMFRVHGEGLAGPAKTRSEPPPPAPRSTPGAWFEVGTTTVALGGDVIVIGRGQGADLQLEDPGISRRHAQVTRVGDVDILADLGSTNGVLVDGRTVTEAQLHDGDRVVLGSTTLVYRRPVG